MTGRQQTFLDSFSRKSVVPKMPSCGQTQALVLNGQSRGLTLALTDCWPGLSSESLAAVHPVTQGVKPQLQLLDTQ